MSLLDVLRPQTPPEPKGARLIRGVLSKPEPLTTEYRREYARAYQRMLKAAGINPKKKKRKQ